MVATLLAGFETNARNDLKDLDSTNYLWTTAELDRHIAHAVNDYQRILPLFASVVITVLTTSSPNANTLTLTRRQQVPGPPPGYLWCERVEYPIDNDPPAYLAFWEEQPVGSGSIYLPTGDPPKAGDPLRIFYAQTHTLSTTLSTIPTDHEELIGLGAVAYAAQAASRYAQNRLNASFWTPRGIQIFATERLAEYQAKLEDLRTQYETAGRPMPQWGEVPDSWDDL